MDMENLARLLSDSLVPKLNPQDIVPGSDSLLAIPDLRWSAASIYELHSDVGMKHVSGPTLPVKNLSDFGVKRQNELSKWNLLAYAGKRYAANLLAPLSGDVSDVTNVQRRLAIMPFARELSPSVANAARGNALIYIATRQGQLVFRNATRVTQANFHQRNLVQMFVELPIWKGQIAIPNGEGRDIYGFFVNVPQTNLVIFAETDKSEVIQKVKDATRRLFTMVTIGILSISFFLFIFLSRMLSGIGQVAKLALTISTGDFSVKVPTAGFGELKTLTQAFSRMVAGLQQRDLVIAGLNKEQIEKVRLAGELEIARGIQENLLPVEELPKENGLRVQALYRPAGECAGDWYGYFYDKPSQITMVFIVDISGHGAGSSIFTAIAAAIFEDFRVSFTVESDPLDLFRSLSHQLQRYGRGSWHATCQAIVYQRTKSKLKIYNAGHPSPMIGPDKDGNYNTVKKMTSDLVGIIDDPKFAVSEIDFLPGQLLVQYSDGLSEMRSPAQKVLGTKKMLQCLHKVNKPEKAVKNLVKTADKFAKKFPQQDDICVIASKCSA